MFWGILTAFLSAINTMVYKKVLVLNTKTHISSPGLYGYMCLLVVIMVGVFHLVSPEYVPLSFKALEEFPWILGGVIAFSCFGILGSLLSQHAYKNEKISILTPYGEAGRIMTIILGFVLYTTTSLNTFLFAMLAAGVLVVSSINFRSFSINKYCLMILLTGLLQSINTLIAGYTIVHLSSFSFILIDNIAITAIVCISLLLFRWSDLRKIPSQTTWPLFGALTLNNLLWIVSYTITLYLMKELGIVMTSLLGMITMALTIVSSFVFFHDKPSRKDMGVAITIIICIIGSTVF